jgi:hypothetical protein
MKNNLDQAMQRTRQYWYADGLSEVAFGAVCLLLGFYFALQATLPRPGTFAVLLDSSFVLIVVGGFLIAGRLVNRAKARLTYPRTGFVAYPRANKKLRLLTAGLAFLIAMIAASFLSAAPKTFDWTLAVTGLLFGAALLYFAYRVGLLRFALLAAVAIILGPALSLIQLAFPPGLAVFYTLMGLALFISGGLTLRSYLKQATETGL